MEGDFFADAIILIAVKSWEHVIQFLTPDSFASIIEDETGRWSERRNAVDQTSRGILVGITREFAKKRKVLAVSCS